MNSKGGFVSLIVTVIGSSVCGFIFHVYVPSNLLSPLGLASKLSVILIVFSWPLFSNTFCVAVTSKIAGFGLLLKVINSVPFSTSFTLFIEYRKREMY